jgi:PIN domain nuclease of toxin-antitoxin system
MIVAIADTHVVIWYLAADPRLSSSAKLLMDTTASNGDTIAVSAITLVEMVYLVEKGKILPKQLDNLSTELDDPDSMFVEVPVNLRIARALLRVDGRQIPDMPDRIIAATAIEYDVPLISRDGKIRQSSIRTIW